MDIMEELKVIAPYLKTPDQTFLAAKSKRYRNEKDSKVEYSRIFKQISSVLNQICIFLLMLVCLVHLI
jgi:hypothetical protein